MAWFVRISPDGSIEQVESKAHPCDPPEDGARPAYDWPRSEVHEVDRPGNLSRERFVPGTGWRAELELVRAAAVAKLDAERKCVEELLSGRGAHARKREELIKFDERKSRLLDAFQPDPAEFPWMAAEASEKGSSIAVIADGIRAAIHDDELEAARLEAGIIARKDAARTAATIEQVESALG